MATKKFNPLEDPPPASSSDEDEVETLSGEDEEEEEQISDDSSSEEEEDDLMNPINIPPLTKPKPPSGSKRHSVLDRYIARTERMEKESEGVCVPLPDDKEIEKKPIKEKESPAVKSEKKRPSESTSSKEVNAKRSKKVSEETKRPSLFQRVWSEEDEISLLHGMIDYNAETGDSPYEDMDGFYEFTRKDISFEARKNQFIDKIRYLKKKYMGKVGKGVESLKKAHDIECFKLFECIWGSNGIALESAVKSGVKKSERKKNLLKPLGIEVEEEVVGLESVAKSNGITKKSEKKPISLEDNGDKVEEEIVALESAVKSGVKKTEKKKNLVKPHGKEVEEEVVGFESVAKSNGITKKSEKKPISMEDNGDKVEEEVVALESAAKPNVTPNKSRKKPISLEAYGDNKEEDKEVLVNVEEYREVLVNGEKVEEDREMLVNGEKVEEDKEVLVSGEVSKSLGVKASDWFEDSFLVGSITSLGVSEQFVKQKWSMVGVETKKRMEEKWKLLQAKEMDLVLQKTDFMREVGSEIAEAS